MNNMAQITIVDNGKEYSDHALYFVAAEKEQVERALSFQYPGDKFTDKLTIIGWGYIELTYDNTMTLEEFLRKIPLPHSNCSYGVLVYGDNETCDECDPNFSTKCKVFEKMKAAVLSERP